MDGVGLKFLNMVFRDVNLITNFLKKIIIQYGQDINMKDLLIVNLNADKPFNIK